VVDISSFGVILYIQSMKGSMHMFKKVITSISIVGVSMWLQGCSSLSTGSQDGIIDVIIKSASTEAGMAPWDPPVGVGYGARIPNMQGDWDRHCADLKGIDPVCR
jgi:hypothetical protein